MRNLAGATDLIDDLGNAEKPDRKGTCLSLRHPGAARKKSCRH
jgi:hypothetical protein